MNILLDGKATLQERFAKIDITRVQKELSNAQKTPEKIPARIKKIIVKLGLPELITNIFVKYALEN